MLDRAGVSWCCRCSMGAGALSSSPPAWALVTRRRAGTELTTLCLRAEATRGRVRAGARRRDRDCMGLEAVATSGRVGGSEFAIEYACMVWIVLQGRIGSLSCDVSFVKNLETRRSVEWPESHGSPSETSFRNADRCRRQVGLPSTSQSETAGRSALQQGDRAFVSKAIAG